MNESVQPKESPKDPDYVKEIGRWVCGLAGVLIGVPVAATHAGCKLAMGASLEDAKKTFEETVDKAEKVGKSIGEKHGDKIIAGVVAGMVLKAVTRQPDQNPPQDGRDSNK